MALSPRLIDFMRTAGKIDRPHRPRPFDSHSLEDDVLHAARERHRLGSLDSVEYAVLEQSSGISIVPKDSKS